MDPQPVVVASAASAQVVSADSTHQSKLRLLCSYGGRVVPRPNDKTLCYVGGETRLVAVDRRIAFSFPSFTAHLSHTLLNGRPFYIKYQLPKYELDSLISITTDEDLANMIDEYDRISLSPQSSRLRLFLFPVKFDPISRDSDTWFFDALRNEWKFADSGGRDVTEFQVDSEKKVGVDSVLGPESIVLETSSSFGSSSSSASVSNLPAIRIGADEGNWAPTPQDPKFNLAPVDSIGSDNSLANPNFQPPGYSYQDPIHSDQNKTVHSNPVEAESKMVQVKGYPLLEPTDHLPPALLQPTLQPPPQLQYTNPQLQTIIYHETVGRHVETESVVSDLSPQMDLLNPFQVSAYLLSQPTDQLRHQPLLPSPPPPLLPPQLIQQAHLGRVHPGTHYMPCCYINAVPTTSYPTIYPSCFEPQQQQSAHYQLKKPFPVFSTPVPEYASKVYQAAAASAGVTPPPAVPSDERQQTVEFPLSNEFTSEYEDPAHAQIYKSQPPAPASKLEAMANAATLISENLTQLNLGNKKPPVR
ncbi:hypothetical protein Nepgr_032449 [Nepenthes gracilis]|uniref:PB1 domain-containing protein n=1 Tax=Nepenthes gracilis TaxID=150966 RepID=A0AAD3TKB0_NEPGR|nr:hypothetical protein Nepgr_032449 [Nepenthes gracilis]